MFDEFGRVVKAIAPNGAETATEHDEVTRTRTATLTAPGADTPLSTTVTTDDPVKRTQSQTVTYADGVKTEIVRRWRTPWAAASQHDNGIGTRQTYRPDGSPAEGNRSSRTGRPKPCPTCPPTRSGVPRARR